MLKKGAFQRVLDALNPYTYTPLGWCRRSYGKDEKKNEKETDHPARADEKKTTEKVTKEKFDNFFHRVLDALNPCTYTPLGWCRRSYGKDKKKNEKETDHLARADEKN